MKTPKKDASEAWMLSDRALLVHNPYIVENHNCDEDYFAPRKTQKSKPKPARSSAMTAAIINTLIR